MGIIYVKMHGHNKPRLGLFFFFLHEHTTLYDQKNDVSCSSVVEHTPSVQVSL